MTWRVLVSAPYMLAELDRFAGFFRDNDIEVVAAEVAERLDEEGLLRYVAGIDGAICGDDRFTDRVLEAAPRLRVICKWGTGIDSIDSEAASRRGILVRRTADAFTDPVADTVIGYILSFARQIPFMDRRMKAGQWEKTPGRALNESTIGVIGTGNVGKAVIRRAKPFGPRLLGNDVAAIDPVFLAETGLEPVALDTLLETADYVSINCDLNPTSRHLVGDAQLARMKPTAVLVNTARGPIIDEAALVRALRGRAIAGAALDVFQDEPLPGDSPLKDMENCLLAPHNSNSSPRAWQRVHENTLRMLVEGLRGGGS